MRARAAGTLLGLTLTTGLLVAPTAPGPAHADDGPATLSNRVVERVVIGRSVRGRKIVAYRKGTPGAKRTVVLLGQMHGDERAGVTTAMRAVRRVPVAGDTDVWIIPTMNPDGLAQRTRTNARGVDLNRNWPMNWRRSARGSTYSGRRAASEPETRAMLRFLRRVQPDFVASVHQPYGEVGYYRDKPRPFQRRLARGLGLPLRGIGIGGPTPPPGDPAEDEAQGLQPGGSDNAPTLTGWYNAHYPGVAITVEFTAHPTQRFVAVTAPRAILAAALARPA